MGRRGASAAGHRRVFGAGTGRQGV